jgi:hypothetical protein
VVDPEEDKLLENPMFECHLEPDTKFLQDPDVLWCAKHPDFPAWLEAQREQPCPPSDGPPEEPTLTVAEVRALKATRIDHPHSMEDSIILQYYGNDISLAQVAALVEAAKAAEGLLSTPGAVTDRVAGVNRSTIRSVLLGLKMSVAPFKSEEGEG